jgi:hypothetical protein
VVFGVLQIVLLEFETLLFFVGALSLDLLAQTLEQVVMFPKYFLVLALFKKLLLVIRFQLVHFHLLVPRNLTNEHLVVRSAAVL